MQVDRLLFPVTALGPGNRLAMWMIGCHKRCKKCANPELQNFDKTKDISVEQLENMILKQRSIFLFTINEQVLRGISVGSIMIC